MAGTLFGLGLSQQFYGGDPAAGALLYVYDANGTTPQSTYAEFALATLQTFPVIADAEGRLPQIWVNDGSYRVRLTTSAGIEIFDEASVTAIGASVTSGGSGGGGSAVDATTIFQTGDPIWVPYAGTRTGWVRANGRTIGSGSSAASERANADTQDLFEYLWNNFSDSLCAVSSGRGGAATTDFNDNKVIATYDMRARGPFGLDDMGNTAAGIISGGTTGGQASGGTLPTYHEASWTPALAFGGATTGITYTTQVGRYVRIDDLITVWGTIILSNNGSATGVVTITGLPYAASTVSGLVQSGVVSETTNITFSGSGLSVSIASAASVLKVILCEGDGGDDNEQFETFGDFTDTAAISFSITYRTDDTTAGTTGSVPVDYRLGTWYLKL